MAGDSASGVPIRSLSTTSLPRRAARGCLVSAHGALSGLARLLFADPLADLKSARPLYLCDLHYYKSSVGCTGQATKGDQTRW